MSWILLGKKSKSGLARWLTLFGLILAVLIKLLTESNVPNDNIMVHRNVTENGQIVYCTFEAWGHKNDTTDSSNCLIINAFSQLEDITIHHLGITVLPNKLDIYIEGIPKRNFLTNKEVRQSIERALISPSVDILGCGYILEKIKGRC